MTVSHARSTRKLYAYPARRSRSVPAHRYIPLMAQTQIEGYRQHDVWGLIDLKCGALETVKYSQQPFEDYRLDVITMLDAAARSRTNPQATIYDDVLDALRDNPNQLATDEQSFRSWSQQSYMNDLRTRVRDLPGPPARQVNDSYVAALDTAVAARQNELDELRTSVAVLNEEVVAKTKELAGLTRKVDAQHEKLTADAATITQAVTTADEQLRREWSTALATWEQERETRDGAIDDEMAMHIQLLSTAALTGHS